MDANMEIAFSELKIMSNGANSVFGTSQPYEICSDLLESVLRYIVLSHRDDNDLSKINGIQTVYDSMRLESISQEHLRELSQQKNRLTILRSESLPSPEFVTSSGWVSLNTDSYPVDNFLSKIDNSGKYSTNAYTSEDRESTLIIAKNVSPLWIRNLCSALFSILKKYYPTKESSEKDKNFFWSIAFMGSNNNVKHPNTGEKVIAGIAAKEIFESYINNACEGLDFIEYMYAKELRGWGAAQAKSQIRRQQDQYDRLVQDIRERERLLSEDYAKLATTNEAIALWKTKVSENDDSVLNFFNQHKDELRVFSFYNDGYDKSLKYVISSTIEYYDDEEFRKIYQNTRSYFWDASAGDFVRKVLKGLFLDHKGTLRTQCVFKLTNLTSLMPERNQIDPTLSLTHFPHPHLVSYACLGNNRQYIEKFLTEGQWDMAIEQSIAASKNLNFSDSTVITSMMNTIFQKRNSCKCIILDDGREVTPEEFVNCLEEENSEE